MGNKILKGEEIHKHYDFKHKLGSGTFATVKFAIKKSTKQEFAVKVIKKAKLNPDELIVVHDEVTIMHKINHPNCVKLFEMYESKKKVYMVLELLNGGELFERILDKGSYSEKEASDLIKDIATAIKYLHSIGVVHRDLKPENLIYSHKKDNEGCIKITDFGLAKFRTDDGKMATACGTPGYVAPEVLKNESYGPPVDLWSLGVILYILLCGFPPFYHVSTSALYRQIKQGQYDFPSPYWDEISDEAKSLVKGMLTVNPAERLTPGGVLDHPWISGGKASAAPFSADHTQRLTLMQARRTLKKGVRSIIAVNRFSRKFKNIVDQQNQ